MTAQKGSLVLIKAGDGGAPEQFDTIGGLRTTRMVLGNQLLDNTHRESGSWQELLSGAGIQALIISGSGLFLDSLAEETIRANAFAVTAKNYRFCFANGDYLTGAFCISEYERYGDHDGAERFDITLISSGVMTYTST